MVKEEALELLSQLQIKLSNNILLEHLYIVKYGDLTYYIDVAAALGDIENIIRSINKWNPLIQKI